MNRVTASMDAGAVRLTDLVPGLPRAGGRLASDRLVGASGSPEFSHRDGSVLCPDNRGRVSDPIENWAPGD